MDDFYKQSHPLRWLYAISRPLCYPEFAAVWPPGWQHTGEQPVSILFDTPSEWLSSPPQMGPDPGPVKLSQHRPDLLLFCWVTNVT